MSNVYDFDDYMTQNYQDTLARASAAADGDPEDAVRALQIGRGSGVPPEQVNLDVDKYDKAYKKNLTSGLLATNGKLRDYVNSHPMAAAVSNDDYGNLADASDKIEKVQHPGLLQDMYDVLKEFTWDPLASVVEDPMKDPTFVEMREAVKNAHLRGGRIDIPGVGTIEGPPGTETQAEEAAKQFQEKWVRGKVEAAVIAARMAWGAKLVTAELSMAMGLFRHWGSRNLEEATGVPKEAFEQGALLLGMGVGAGLHLKYGRSGREPPTGLNPMADTINKTQSDIDLKNLKEAESASDKTNTLARDRDLYARQFVDEVHGPPRPIGINIEKIEELYGDKEPTPDDNKLGFVDNLRERIQQAKDSGKGEIQISLGDWMSKVDPETRDFLRDTVRPRPGGLTKEERKEMPEAQAIDDEVEAMRKAAGLPTTEERLAPTEEAPTAEAQVVTGAPPAPEAPKIVRREGRTIPSDEQKAPKGQLELDVSRMSEKELFDRASRLGRTVDQFKRLMKWVKEDTAARAERKAAAKAAGIKREQTAEWKENRATTREEVERQVRNMPEVGADEILRTGQKLDKRFLTAEQAVDLKDIVSDGEGIHPDDIAGVFGYESGQEMVEALRGLHQIKNATNMNMGQTLRRLVDALTDGRMREKYGDLGANVEQELRDVKEGAFSEGLLRVFHEDTVRAAEKAGAQRPIDQRVIDQSVRQAMRAEAIENLNSDHWISRAGRAGAKVEQWLTKKMPGRAVAAMQVQYRALRASKIALAYEEARAKFDKIVDRFAKRDVTISIRDDTGSHSKVFPTDHLNIIHAVMDKVGIEIRRGPQDLARELAAQPEGDIESFVKKLNDKGANLSVPDFLRETGKRELDKLSLDEFNSLHTFLHNLVEAGRNEGVIRFGNETLVKETAMEGLNEQLDKLGQARLRDPGSITDNVAQGFSTLGHMFLKLQDIFSRIDRGDPLGLFSRMFVQTGMKAGHDYQLFKSEFSRMYRDLPKMKWREMREKISGSPFVVPDGRRLPMTRKTLLGVMMHYGNPSNWDKLVRGWKPEGMDPNGFKVQVEKWVQKNARDKDWEFVQKAGKIFGEIAKREAAMERGLGNMPYEQVELGQVDIGGGKMVDGWYAPLERDHLYAKSKEDPFAENNVQSTTPPGYYKKRTGEIYPLNLNIDALPQQITKRLRNLAFRPFVVEASKFFYDKEFTNAIQEHMGESVHKLLDPYLKRLTQPAGLDSAGWQFVDRTFELFRQNIVADLIGMASSTVVKHGLSAAVNSLFQGKGMMGPAKFLRDFGTMATSHDFNVDANNWRFAMENSRLLQSRVASKMDNLMGTHEDVIGRSTLRTKLMEAGSWAVSKVDLLSAVPTWLAEYRAQVDQVGHRRAVYLADWAVQQAHGSTAITAKPEIMISKSATVRGMTSLYNFFNTMLNRQYGAAWRAADAYKLWQTGERVDRQEAAAHASRAAMLITTSVILPAIVEELAAPIPMDEDESYWWHGAKVIGAEISSGIPIVREIAHALVYGQDPTISLFQTGSQRFSAVAKDLVKAFGEDGISEENAGKLLKDVVSFIGVTTGYTNEAEANFLKGIVDVYNEQQQPEGIKEAVRLITKGDVEKVSPLEWLLPGEAREPKRR